VTVAGPKLKVAVANMGQSVGEVAYNVLSAILYAIPCTKIIEVVAVEFMQVRRKSHEQHWQAVELRWMMQRR
jgi:hypothetical protein